MKFRCGYCFYRSDAYKEVISHLIENHSMKELFFSIKDGRNSKNVSYKIIPDICREEGRVISIDEDATKIHVSRRGLIPKDSPVKKIFKTRAQCTFNDQQLSEFVNADEVNDNEKELGELSAVLPRVITCLKEIGKFEDYLSFNKPICEGKFPLDNIAFLLFLDVVRWYSLDKSTNFMRYNEDTKLFWKTGYKLFRGKFLRFMGGPKNKGQLAERGDLSGNLIPEQSKVNFVVPDKKGLKDTVKYIESEQPGIFSKMIDTVAKSDPNQLKTFKICVDGKKINPSSCGEVDLWGYEDEPTYKARKERRDGELKAFELTTQKVESFIKFGSVTTSVLSDKNRQNLIEDCKKAITTNSYRIKDLRMLKVRKNIALQKLQEQVHGDWRSSTFALVISSIRTNIYLIDNNIEDLLSINDQLSEVVATESGFQHFRSLQVVDLNSQGNLACLGQNTGDGSDSRLVKQRSETWHKIRNSAIVTGSTIHKAIGLDGLREQQLYIDVKSGRKKLPPVSEELSRNFQHGADNEVNAVATMVCKFLPVFEPQGIFYEEGCYVMENSDSPRLVVSPDGSMRSRLDEKVISGVEIKCPLQGKLYTTPVQYNLPKYYVTQVFSEMACLEIDNLYFVSYSKESTVFHRVDFDQELWKSIQNEINAINLNSRPKRTRQTVHTLKSKTGSFCASHVKLIAEIRSCTAKQCVHTPEENGRVFHSCQNYNTKETVLLENIQRLFIRIHDSVEKCDKLCCVKASEVLVFVLADLDRVHKPEIPNAFPIAYGFKGYSMKAAAMRSMIEDVLYELFLKGLYTPVVSYDEQWASLALKAADGKSLTILELQKDVYNEMKTRKKPELSKELFETAVVKSDLDLSTQIYYKYDAERKSVVVAVLSERKPFQPSLHVREMLIQSKYRQKNKVSEVPREIEVLSDITVEVLDKLNKQEIEALRSLNEAKSSCSFTDQSTVSEIDLDLFKDTDIVNSDTETNLFEIGASFCEPNGEFTMEEDDPSNENTDIFNEGLDTILEPETADRQTSCTTLAFDDASGLAGHIHCMLTTLRSSSKCGIKWKNITEHELKLTLSDTNKCKATMTKAELLICLEYFVLTLNKQNVRYSRSWNKTRLAELLFAIITNSVVIDTKKTTRRQFRNPQKLTNLCKKEVNKFPKLILNVIFAEKEIVNRIKLWRETSPFATVTQVEIESMVWFSAPEYNQKTMSYIFSYLDMHHLITNCRVKVCKDGFPERGIHKNAWFEVAKENNTNLKISHVEDLVDKQSDAIA